MKIKNYLLFILLISAGFASAQYRFAGRVMGFGTEYSTYPQSWCASQALGTPNVYPNYDDIDGAWTVRSYGKKRDTLILGFDNNSPIDSILIWETSGAGIIDSVYVFNPSNSQWQLVFGRKGKNYPKAGDTLAKILRIGFAMTSFNVNQVRIHLASDSSKSWPEIDAVAIHPQTLTATTYSELAGTAVTFDGKDDYYRTDFSTWELLRHSALTYMTWVNVMADTAVKEGKVDRGSGVIYDASFQNFGLTHVNLGGGDSLYSFIKGNTAAAIGIPYTKNNWQHIAVTIDTSAMKVYLNGELYRISKGTKFDSTNAFGLLEFGRNYNRKRYLNGSMDEVKVFNRVLSASEILKQKYSIGQSAVTAKMMGYWQFNEGSDSSHWNTNTHLTDSLHNGASYITTGTVLAVNRPQVSKIQIYPNPNKGNFDVLLPENTGKNVSIKITDMSGKMIFDKEMQVSNNRVSVQLAGAQHGIYMLQFSDGFHTGSLRFIAE